MTTTTDHDDPPTTTIPAARHAAEPAEPGWFERARGWLPSHEGGDYRGVDRVLLVLYAVAQAYASVNLVQLALWADHGPAASAIPAVLIDGSALVLAAVFADRARGVLIRSAAALLSLLLFATSVAATGLNELVHRPELAAYWTAHKSDVSLALAVAPTVLVGVLIVMRLVIASARRADEAAAAERAAEQAAADADQRAADNAARAEAEAIEAARQREQDELEAEHRRGLEVLEAQRAAADDEARRRREDEDREAQRLEGERESAHRRSVELETARREADEAAAAQRREDEDRAERAAAREAKRAERAAAPAPPARKAAAGTASARGESGAVRGRRWALQRIVADGRCPNGPDVAKHGCNSTDPKAGKRVLAALADAGLVGESAQDGSRPVLDLEGCRSALAELGPDPQADEGGRRLEAV